MQQINKRLRERVGFPLDEAITLQTLELVLERMAKTVPFENTAIIEGRTEAISEKYLMEKVIGRQEGGLCFDLNPLLYLFLLENGFQVTMIKGITYDAANKTWSKTGATHAAILLEENGRRYIVDSGFGANLPLKPVPLDGEIIQSDNGQFQIKQEETEYGDYCFFMKLKDKSEEWTLGYAFQSTVAFYDVKDMIEMQKTIVEHPDSRFNKGPLVSMLTDKGSMVLSQDSFTEWIDGKKHKQDINTEEFSAIAKERFGLR
ncbi:arylamine N-acetyltransferase [Niallia circulans]|uniref:Arylamine N-acetyltransferase n=1 Tax=Niallia circulans TaxID=1397 RepID=A0A553SNK2_NIACI|nr:arylamine N-acetyltransferase [Niallia circulans]TRZ38579.1 arylamine N-acetyltransferase [Niallia circulans]